MTDPFDGDVEVAELYAARLKEWSKWEARDEIVVGNALAYAPGHAVPTSNVERWGYAKAGKVRLAAAWVVDNPDDEDVKKFLTWAKTHEEHPDVVAYKAYADTRTELEAQRDDDNPFAEEPPTPTRTSRKTADSKAESKADSKATAPTADKE